MALEKYLRPYIFNLEFFVSQSILTIFFQIFWKVRDIFCGLKTLSSIYRFLLTKDNKTAVKTTSNQDSNLDGFMSSVGKISGFKI